jgi:hypothetical protein
MSLKKQRMKYGAVFLTVAFYCSLAGPAFATGDANEGACPNEASPGFRSNLPDCRAYEMVTPVDKNGALINPISSPTIAPDGSSLAGQSQGAFAGLLSNELPALTEADYRFTRTDSGWVTAPLNPFQTISRSIGIDDSIWAPVFAGAGPDQLSVVEQNGTVSDVGPVWSPTLGPTATPGTFIPSPRAYSVAGAASDTSNGVVFTLTNPALYWPFDTTVSGPALYEYKGVNNAAPELVGVSGGADSTVLVSQCGISLGGTVFSDKEVFNAVSEDGNTVFFTAEKGGCSGETRAHESVVGTGPPISELYARRSSPAATVAISEPTSEDCEECDTSEAAIEATTEPAAFQGASSDGSKVYFTTNQELMPGQTGTNLYEYDFDAPAHHKLILVSSGTSEPQVQGVARISSDGSHSYFVARGVLASNSNGTGQSPLAGAENFYVYQRDEQYPEGHLAFIAQLCTGPGQSGTVSDSQCPDTTGVEGNESDQAMLHGLGGGGEENRPAQSSPNGRFLVFTSCGDLTAGDTSSARQVFQYDAQTGDLVRVSIGQDGYNDDGNSVATSGTSDASIATQGYEAPMRGGAIARTMSDNGAYVFFQSPVGLTPQALNLVALTGEESGRPVVYARNVYEYHAGHVYLISDGSDTSSLLSTSDLIGTTESGNDVFFRSGDSLVPQDTDTQMDIYDARVDGGFPAPEGSAQCENEDCQGAASQPPSLVPPQSVTFVGAGNLRSPATPPMSTSMAKPLTRAQKLASALKTCRKQARRRRAVCELQARKRYGSKPRVVKTRRAKAGDSGKRSA